jgi:putative phage-type endonuclease
MTTIPIAQLSRAEWLEVRRQGIGSSDAPAICGFDRWRSPYAVWVSKIEPPIDDDDSTAAEWGRRLEQVVAEKFYDEHGLTSCWQPTVMYRHPEHPWMLASPDRIVTWPDGTDGLLEVKTTGSHMATDWADGPPARVRVQVQHQLAVTGLQRAHVAVLVGGQRYEDFEVPRDEDDIAAIIAVESEFWTRNVLERIPPPIDGSESTSDAIRALYARVRPDVEVDLPEYCRQVLADLRHTRALIKDMEVDERKFANEVKAVMGEAEVGLLDGAVAVTWRQTTARRVDIDRLRADHPEIAESCTIETTTRRFLPKG